jgi:small subunit ribosomal protein S20
MPIKKSAIKELRKTKKRTIANSNRKRKIRDTLKDIRKSLESQNIEEAKKMAQEVIKLIDKAEKRNIFHKNTAARKKSRILKAINKTVKK